MGGEMLAEHGMLWVVKGLGYEGSWALILGEPTFLEVSVSTEIVG